MTNEQFNRLCVALEQKGFAREAATNAVNRALSQLVTADPDLDAKLRGPLTESQFRAVLQIVVVAFELTEKRDVTLPDAAMLQVSQAASHLHSILDSAGVAPADHPKSRAQHEPKHGPVAAPAPKPAPPQEPENDTYVSLLLAELASIFAAKSLAIEGEVMRERGEAMKDSLEGVNKA